MKIAHSGKRHLPLLALLSLVAFASHAQTTPPPVAQGLFIDHSGSMRPYFQSGLVSSIVTPLAQAVTPSGGLQEYAFSNEVSSQLTLEQIQSLPFGNYTFLDKVIDASERRHLGIAWLITDNIEDTGEAGNTERFYARLRGPDVEKVTIFPVLAHSGSPGLVVYALLFNGGSAAAYSAALAGFAQGGAGVLRTEPLRMKPLDRDTVEVTSRSLTPLTRRGGPKVYATGVPIRESVEVRFKSRFDHIEIVDSALQIVGAAPTFQADSLLTPQRRAVAVTPDRIKELGPGSETTQVYRLTVDLGRVSLKNSPIAWWKAAWNKPEEEAELDLKFAIDVPQQNFRLTPQFLSRYSASSVAQASATGKVYALDRLLSQVNAGDTRVVVSSPVFFRVRYPSWPAILWITLFATLAALGALLFLLLRRLLTGAPTAWDVSAKAVAGYPIDARMEGDRVIVEGEAIGRVDRKLLLPLGSTLLRGGKGPVSLESGVPLPATLRGLEAVLLFTGRSKRIQETTGTKTHSGSETGGSSSTGRGQGDPPRPGAAGGRAGTAGTASPRPIRRR